MNSDLLYVIYMLGNRVLQQVISTMRDKVEHAVQIPEVVSNPLFLGILEGLCSDYIVFEQ